MPPFSHPEADHTPAAADRFGRDRLLRTHGYAIWRRKKGMPVLWIKGGVVVTEAEALDEILGQDRGHGRLPKGKGAKG